MDTLEYTRDYARSMGVDWKWVAIISGALVTLVALVGLGEVEYGTHGAMVAGLSVAIVAGVGIAAGGLLSVGREATEVADSGNSASTPTQRLEDAVRATIALFTVFVGFGGIIYFVLSQTIAVAQGFASIIAGILGSVVGYYFGSHGANTAQAQAQKAIKAETLAKETRDDIARASTPAKDLVAYKSAENFRAKVLQAAAGDSQLLDKLNTILEDSDIEGVENPTIP